MPYSYQTESGELNVSAVRNAGLCMGCGTCEGICPFKAVEVRRHQRKGIYLPNVDNNLCTHCGLCLEVCPGVSVDINQLADEFLDSNNKEEMIGKYSEFYIGHSTDQDIRYNSASGGLVTSLLIYALETKMIDGALVLGMDESNPLETKPYIATTPSEVISASGSKYCPSCINVKLRQIMLEDGRFAVVGLPCHIHAIRKLEMVNTKFREKIVLLLGLFCANNNTYLGTEYFLRQNEIMPENVKRISYRAEGWPGKIRVDLINNITKIIPRGTTEVKLYRRILFGLIFHYCFEITRCLLCVDQTCELADISFGDPWSEQYKKSEKIGKSLVIVRNSLGSKLIANAMESGVIELDEVPISSVKKAQGYKFKNSAGARIYLRRILGLKTPDYGERNLRFGLTDIFLAFRYLPSYLSHHRWFWHFIKTIAIVYCIELTVSEMIKTPIKFCLRNLGLRKTF